MTNQAAQTMQAMTPERCSFFLRRFKNDEKMLGPNEQLALDYAIAALSQTAGVAEGYVLVPVEPTEAMCEAAMSSLGWSRSQAAATAAPITPASPMMEGAMKVWSAMLAAAPAAIATSKTDDRCTDPENCKRCSEDASTPHAGIPHAAPAESGGEAKPAFGKERPSSDEEAMYDAAAKGFHTSETSGTDGRYVHVIRFQSIEELHAYEHAWTAAMVKVRDSRD